MNISINKQPLALYLIVLSLPLNWYGITNFEPGGKSSTEALLFAVVFTAGLALFCGGIYMAFKERKGRGETLASQTSEDPPISIINNPINEENEMSEIPEIENRSSTLQVGRSSVELMKREKELKIEEKELNFQLEQIRLEKVGIEQELQTKGWIKNYEREWDVPAL